MARFFQHLAPGDNLGKVTRLKYIDDITDDEMILFCFEDGTRCNQEFIATPEDPDPMANKKAMVELTGPTHPWIINRKEIIPDEDRIIVGADGVRYQAPDPTVKTSGSGQSLTVEQAAKQGIRTEILPPKVRPKHYTIEPDEVYALSAHPELENGGSAAPEPVVQNPAAILHPHNKKPTAAPKMPVAESIDNFDIALEQTAVPQQPSQISAAFQSQEPPVQSDTMTINMDKNRVRKIEIIMDGMPVTLDRDEFMSRLCVSSQQYQKVLADSKKSTGNLSAIIEKEDVLIKNMIDKSRKNTGKINMALSLNIPPQEVYDTIKNVYEENMLDGFTTSLAARYLSQENMLASISSGLKAYYEKNSSSNKGKKESSQGK